MEETAEQLKQLVEQGEVMAQKYWVTVTNPPYAGMSKMNAKLNSFVQDNYADYKSDMFSAFVVKCSTMTRTNGYCAFLTPYVWMFIQSYEKMRNYLYANTTIETLIQFEYSAFEEATVPICTFAFRKGYIAKKGCYLRLTDFRGGMEVQRQKTLEAINNHNCGYYFEQYSDNFAKIPGSPVAYWVSEKFTNMYKQTSIAQIATTREGMTTADNDQFVRLWEEVNSEHIAFGCTTSFEAQKTNRRWFPYAKGGDFRKWYGNSWYVVDWQDDGWRIRNFKDEKTGRIRSHNYNLEYIFRECLSWTRVTSGNFCIRYYPKGYLCDTAGAGLFVEKDRMFLLGWLSTNIVNQMLQIQNPTIVVQAGDVARIPVPEKKNNKQDIENLVEDNISISKEDWDSFETSWDFKVHPLV